LWLNQETVHRLHFAVLATMRPALDPAGHRVLKKLVFSTPGGLTGNDLSRLFFTCTNTSQAATYTNTSQAATCTCDT
jgi:hypothetical protein